MLEITGNWFALVAILSWPVVTILLFNLNKPAEATVWTILAALLFLPTGPDIKIPMIPALDKSSVPNVCALVACIIFVPRPNRLKSKFGVAELLMLLLVLGPVVTSQLNNDVVFIGDRVLPGVGYYDGISALIIQLITLLPFIVGRRLFRTEADVAVIPRALAIAGLIYSVPMLLEVRLSPQLSTWIYGYFQGFNTEMRYGGFRPVVFMKNGLATAFFMATAVLASLVMWRANERIRLVSFGPVSGYLGVVLVLCKSAGALVYGILGGLAVLFAKPKTLLRVAVTLAVVGLSYPLLRVTDIFPDKALVETASTLNTDRAMSLKFRFDQERRLLDRAAERFMFGWGRYGRNRVYEESGKDSSITDGAWIQVLGQFGLIGFLSQFGLLALPIFRAASVFKFNKERREALFISLLALIAALSLIEQIPNSSVSSWTWFVAGSLLGAAERVGFIPRRHKSQKSVESRANERGYAIV